MVDKPLSHTAAPRTGARPGRPASSAPSTAPPATRIAPAPAITRWLPLALFLLAALVYLRALTCGFVLHDDPDYVTQNPRVLAGLSLAGVRWAFTTGHTGYWHPLTWLSLMLDADLTRLFALHNHPALFYHATNLLLHALNVVLVFLALRRLTSSAWRSAFVAAVFAVHPLHVESVAWISERKDLLCAAFALITIIAYTVYAQAPSWKRYLLVLLFYACSLMAKPMAVTLPCLLLLLDYWPLGRFKGNLAPQAPAWPAPTAQSARLVRLIVEKLPLLAMAMAISALTVAFQRIYGAIRDDAQHTQLACIANALVSYTRYLGKMVWFKSLALEYPFPSSLPPWQVAGAAALLLLITAFALWNLRRWPHLAVGWFWFLGTLVPVIGFIPAGSQAMADRYSYLPSIGLLIALVWSLPERLVALPAPLPPGEGGRYPGRGRAWKTSGLQTYSTISILGLLLLTLSTFTFAQIAVWHDTFTLWSHAAAVIPGHFVAQTHVADELMRRGDTAGALEHSRLALAARPWSAVPHANYAAILMQTGRRDQAVAQFEAALAINPQMPEALNNLGYLRWQSGDDRQAARLYLAAIAARPDYAAPHVNLGLLYSRRGDLPNAERQYRAAIALDPAWPDARLDLAAVLLRQGRREEALASLRVAVDLAPDSPKYRHALAAAEDESLR